MKNTIRTASGMVAMATLLMTAPGAYAVEEEEPEYVACQILGATVGGGIILVGAGSAPTIAGGLVLIAVAEGANIATTYACNNAPAAAEAALLAYDQALQEGGIQMNYMINGQFMMRGTNPGFASQCLDINDCQPALTPGLTAGQLHYAMDAWESVRNVVSGLDGGSGFNVNSLSATASFSYSTHLDGSASYYETVYSGSPGPF